MDKSDYEDSASDDEVDATPTTPTVPTAAAAAAAPVLPSTLIDAIRAHAPADALGPLIVAYKASPKTDRELGEPLREAIKCSCSLQVVTALIDAFPKHVRRGIWAASFEPQIEVEVLEALLAADTDGAKSMGNGGTLPIHSAAQLSTSVNVIEVWIAAYPEGLGIKGRGLYPVEWAARESSHVDVLCAILDAEEHYGIDQEDSYPLHEAAAHSVCEDIVKALIKRFPDALQANDSEGNLPLHRAATTSKSVSIVRALICQYSEDDLGFADEEGLLPLHSCALRNSCEEVFDLLLNAYPEAAGVTNDNGETLLHRLIASRVDCVRALKVLSKDTSLATVQENNDWSLPLHIAARKTGTSSELFIALMSAFPAGCAVPNRTGSLALHIAAQHDGNLEIVKRLVEEFPPGVYTKDTKGHVPLYYVVSFRSHATEIVLYLLDRAPELVDVKWKLSNPEIKDLCRAYCKSFTPSRTNISNFHIHICGEPFAGKSVVFYWMAAILRQNRSVVPRIGDKLPFSKTLHDIEMNDRRATRGTVSDTVPYLTEDSRSLHCILRDYGAQAQFKLTHPQFLSCPNSIYVIVLPLFDKSEHSAPGRWYTAKELTEQLIDWLRMIYSVITVPVVDEGDSDDDESFKTTTDMPPNYAVPVLVIANKFARAALKGQNLLGLSDIQAVIAAAQDYFKDPDGLAPDVFHFMAPALIDACRKGDVYCLEAPLIEASELVASSKQYTKYDCVDFVINHLPVWLGLLELEQDVLRQLKDVFVQHNYQLLSTMTSTNAHVATYLANKQPAERLAAFCLEILIEMNHLMVLNNGLAGHQTAGSRIIITDPNWLTNKVVGEVLHETAKQASEGKAVIHGRAPLVYTDKELNAMVPNLPPGMTVGMVLETMGLALPVSINSVNEILPTASGAGGNLFLLGLVDLPMPHDIRDACEAFPGDPKTIMQSVCDLLDKVPHSTLKVVRSVARLFGNKRCLFIPGFYMKLFMFMHNINSGLQQCWYWKGGLVMKSIVRWKVGNGQLMEGRKETLLYSYNNHGVEGFVVKISVWLDDAVNQFQAPKVGWEGFLDSHDIVLEDLNKIREFILSTGHWKIAVDEYVLLLHSVPLLLSKAELDWFQIERSRRMQIRTPLIGFVLDYSPFITSERNLQLSLSKLTPAEQFFCSWSGTEAELVAALRRVGFGVGPDVLTMWIVRYYRLRSMKLSIDKCEDLVRQVRSDDADDNDDESDHSDGSTSQLPSQLDTIMDALTRIEHGTRGLAQEQRDARQRYVDDSRKIHMYPLLAVMSEYTPSSAFGRCKVIAGTMIGITTYRLHFHCSVCGCRSPTAGKGYKLNIGTEETQTWLQVFQWSLILLDAMLTLGGVPNQIASIAELAVSSLDIIELENIDAIADDAIAELRSRLDQFVSQVDQSAMLSSQQPDVLLDSTRKDERTEKVVTSQHIDAMEHLFKVRFQDDKAKRSGLEKAITKDGEVAWVCTGVNGKKSCCYEEFKKQGQDCVAVITRYE